MCGRESMSGCVEESKNRGRKESMSLSMKECK